MLPLGMRSCNWGPICLWIKLPLPERAPGCSAASSIEKHGAPQAPRPTPWPANRILRERMSHSRRSSNTCAKHLEGAGFRPTTLGRREPHCISQVKFRPVNLRRLGRSRASTCLPSIWGDLTSSEILVNGGGGAAGWAKRTYSCRRQDGSTEFPSRCSSGQQ